MTSTEEMDMQLRVWFVPLLLISTLLAKASERWIAIDDDPSARQTVVNAYGAGGSAWELRAEIPGISVTQISRDGRQFDAVSLMTDGFATTADVAELPALSQWIGLRNSGDPVLEIITADWVNVAGYFDLLPPAEAESRQMQRTSSPAEEFCTISERQIMGGVGLAQIRIEPFMYDREQRQLHVLRNLTLRVRETGAELPVRPITETTASLLRPLLPNWDEMDLDELVVRGTLLYILADNGATQTAVQSLIAWRKQKGYRVEVAGPAQIGTPLTTANVKQFIQNRYNSADPPLEFVCLVGDGGGSYVVPAYLYRDPGNPFEDGVGDHDYTRLDGSDLLPDVAIGRLSFGSSSGLLAIVNKILRYEQNPAPRTNGSKPNWYKSGAVVGDADHQAVSISHVQTVRWVRERMLEAGYYNSGIDTLYWTTYGGDVPASVMSASINAGASLWTYRGWNRMNAYTTADAAALANVGHWPFMLLLTCNTNNFDAADLAETFLNPNSSPANPTGAIGVVGMSSGATHTRYNNILTTGAVQGMLRENVHTTGGSLNRSKLELRRNYPLSADSAEVGFFMGITSLQGDPAVDVYIDTPDTLLINNPPSLPVGSNALTLTVTRPGGQTISGAYVNLVKGTEIFTGGTTDAAGRVTLNFTTTTAETLFVTASKHNCLAARAYTLVATSAYCVAPATAAFVIDDDNNGTSQGNGDGRANPGETVELAVSLRNWGTSPVTGVTAVLSTTSPFISGIPDNMESYGGIAPGATTGSPDDFDFTVAAYAPHGQIVQFTLTVTDDAARSWSSSIPVTIANADLAYSSATVTGAGNGILDPGESGQLTLQLANSGLRNLIAGRTAYLRINHPAIAVTDSVGTFAAIAAGGSGSNSADPFGVSALAAAFSGERAAATCIFPLTDGFADTIEFNLPIGTTRPDAPTPRDTYGYWAFDDTDVACPKHPVFNWVEIDPDYGGTGTHLPLTDAADIADMSIVVDLPFTFRYYGRDFTQITVCTNGWLAMGAGQVVHTDFRNYNIPGAMGPSGMIAPFWDDLRTSQPTALSMADMEQRMAAARGLDEGGEGCNTAAVISSLPYTDTGYTCDNGNTCGQPSRDVFYRYNVPPEGQRLTISLCGSEFDTYLSVWNPCCDNSLISDNNGCEGSLSSQISQVFPGGNIWILVEGFGMRCGDYTINVTGAALLPPGHICSVHDAANHRFIVQWSRVFKYNGSDDPPQTFQCILYEPGYPPTPTGDGEILFQYLTCTNAPDAAASNDYCTTGIENFDQTDGVLYSYYNRTSPDIPGAAALADGRAILFTTGRAPIDAPRAPERLTAYSASGSILLRWRQVREDVNGNPLAGVQYRVYRGTQWDFVPDGLSFRATVSDTTFTESVAPGAVFYYIVQAEAENAAAALPPASAMTGTP